jgi:DNA gyrase inhibitor GyrI
MQIENFRPVRLASLRYVGPYSVAISEFMRAFNEARNERGWIGDSFGIAIAGETYGTALHELTTDAPLCRFDAAIAVSSDALIEPPFAEDFLPGGAYGICEFSGTPFEIGTAWARMLTVTIPASGLTIDFQRPNFEWYRTTDSVSADGKFNCALCVSVLV